VTGSKCLVDTGSARLLVDCGLFQGLKRLRERNWQRLPFDVTALDAIVLTHAHLDHTGFLPVLVRQGFSGNVYCTAATAKLVEILLPDSAHLQEEEARYANKHRFSKHKPALPLYTREDAAAALKLLHPVDWAESVAIRPDVSLRKRSST
jgi:metallo-beta-lactamase family protein